MKKRRRCGVDIWRQLSPKALAFLAWEGQRVQRKTASLTVMFVILLFAPSLVSLLMGHAATDIDWYSQRLMKQALFGKLKFQGRRHHEHINIWKSTTAELYYGCS